MRKTLSTALLVCSLAWCTSAMCEEKQLDPGVINSWMRSAIYSDTDNTEVKRVIHNKSMENWESSSSMDHVRYEVTNANCQRTLMFYVTDAQGKSYFDDWIKLIEDDQSRESTQLTKPKVFVRAYREGAAVSEFPILDLEVEYQVRDGLPVLVASNQMDVKRTLEELGRGARARVRVDAFDGRHIFRVNLRGFTDMVKWSDAHCPDDNGEVEQDKKDSVLSPASS